MFAGISRPLSMNDRRIARKPGNPISKYPYFGNHSWNLSKKYICEDFRNPDPKTSLAHFVVTYHPVEETEIVQAVKRVLERYLPGCKISLEPILARDTASFKITRLNDKRVILETVHPVKKAETSNIAPLFHISSAQDLTNDLSNMQQLVKAASTW